MATGLVSSKPTNAIKDPLESIYTMFYRKDTNHLQSKNFRHIGDLKSAVERAKKHCGVLGARFMFVQPLISDLSREEEFILQGARKNEKMSEVIDPPTGSPPAA